MVAAAGVAAAAAVRSPLRRADALRIRRIGRSGESSPRPGSPKRRRREGGRCSVSGIAGIFHYDGRPATASELRALTNASKHRAIDGEDSWVCGSFGVAHQHARNTPESLHERQPLVSAAETVVCIDGRLDDREELPRPRSGASTGASDAELVLSTYERDGDRFASHLNGDFAVAVFDARRHQLLLARDVMAARPLYYCPIAGTVLFASEIKSLLAHPQVAARPDEDAIAQLMLDDWSDVHRTCFHGIFSVPPGAMAIVTRDGAVLREHWTFDPGRSVRYRSFAEYVEAFRELFERSVKRRLRSTHPIAVSVSGGVDSSAIFCQAAVLARRGAVSAPLQGITMTFPEGSSADEQQFIDDIESSCGVTVARVGASEVAAEIDCHAVVDRFEMPGMLGHSHRAVLERARAAGCRTMLDGFFGDQMLFTRAGYLVDLARKGRWLHVGDWRGRTSMYPSWFTGRLRQRALARHTRPIDYRASPVTYHAQELHGHVTAGHYLSQLHRQISAGQMYGVDVCYPFRDRDLVAFLMAIPGEIVNWRGVPKGLMREALKGVLAERIRTRQWKADLTRVGNQAAARGHETIARLLTRDCLSARLGFVDGVILEQSIAALAVSIAEDETATTRWQLEDAIGLEVWLQRFFGDRAANI
ncbi:MAG: hypothetical protein DMF99_07475 [Acidobacteria bacterium]|nr:MAG: hypothetical protein DMF99_07475 [Acidobacteriota bacterium]